MELGKLGVWYFTDGMAATDAATAAKKIEDLGYSALWLPETVGRNPFAHAAWLLANTTSLVVATGIANIYHREPGVTLAAQHTLAEQSDNRFLLGLGVSHKPLVEGLRGLKYGKPVSTMRAYLQKMKASPYTAPRINESPKTVIAALGPKMLELAADEADGAHPYFTSPEHTRVAREIMGPDAWLCVEQKVIMETDSDKARAAARRAASTYQGLPNYRNNWLRMGLSEADISDTGSDKFIDTTFAWGDVDAIQQRIDEHLQAGANHVCVQPIRSDGNIQQPDWDALEALAAM
ncbi:MAG: TIGR03620 family F420-dependent LLM class oxidoreductase [Gammaproteobacteria bacterium]|nr:TIGR03620 family F420-dependent LLM class oxidoreductase [Gammaproteobacteria bacterium]